MSLNINSVIVTGNLTADPELRSVTKGDREMSFCDFRIAVNHGKDSAGEDRPASFFSVTSFGATAKACADHLAKGRKVAVSGELKQERWEDKETGGNRERVKISATRVEFISPRPQNGDAPVAEMAPAAVAEDDIPF